MTDVHIVGSGSTRCGQFPTLSPKALAREAVTGALLDAGMEISDIECVVVANALAGLIDGQECVRGQVFLREAGLDGRPVVNVENACASGSTGIHVARGLIRSGQYETVLVLGIEKMSTRGKAHAVEALKGALDREETGSEDRRESEANVRSVFMEIYAEKARAHAARFGSTVEDYAAVVVKNRQHASNNPYAQYREKITLDEVLNARTISAPLTRPMCSPIGDGAAVIVLTAGDRLKQARRRVVVAGCSLTSGKTDAGDGAVVRAARAAYDESGIEPSDIDVAEVHDATASAEIEECENLGIAREGEGHLLLRSGATALGGSIPVNPSGGLICRGHPVGATGVLQVVELVRQLRGCAEERQVRPLPRCAVAQNAGGFVGHDVAAAVVTVLIAHD